VDANGILSVNAREESTGRSKNIKIRNEKGRLNKNEIEQMVRDAELFKEEDERCRMRIDARNLLESYLFSVRSALKQNGRELHDADRLKSERLINENIAWLEQNREQEANVFESKKKSLEAVFMPILDKIHKSSKEDENRLNNNNNKGGPRIEEVH
jgi:heat shock protein 1/8